ncbi:MAG: zf-HC2 domain-containing protein [Planctomycetota bacterium]
MSFTACDAVRRDLAQYVRGSLAAARCEAIERHLQDCVACADDMGFATDMDRVMREELAPQLDGEFIGRVMARVRQADAPRRSRPALVMQRPLAVLASAAAVLCLLTLGLRQSSAPLAPRLPLASGERTDRTGPTTAPRTLLAQLKVALDSCEAIASAPASEEPMAGLGRFPSFAPDEGHSSDPAYDSFYLTGPYASLFSGGEALPRFEVLGS